ncbi:hypothetical protein J4Q44_G00379130 [Coregonus suidteri]|uniref:Uncharacterized protein n=1 Tax=Coregonus suidteri TaxID=861788 RepID=A0AAN8QDF3_9TELE
MEEKESVKGSAEFGTDRTSECVFCRLCPVRECVRKFSNRQLASESSSGSGTPRAVKREPIAEAHQGNRLDSH